MESWRRGFGGGGSAHVVRWSVGGALPPTINHTLVSGLGTFKQNGHSLESQIVLRSLAKLLFHGHLVWYDRYTFILNPEVKTAQFWNVIFCGIGKWAFEQNMGWMGDWTDGYPLDCSDYWSTCGANELKILWNYPQNSVGMSEVFIAPSK